MGKITHSRYEQLVEMGREPINLPYEIYFNGNEILQKTPGSHHLQQYRETGTYNHPNIRAMRKREALDYATRLLNGKMSAVSLRKIGGMNGLKKRLDEFGLAIDKSQQQIINMNADMLESEYKARKETSEQERKNVGREEVIQEPVAPDAEQKVVTGASEALERKLSPADNLSSGDEDEKERVKNMSFKELQNMLKEKGIKQGIGETTEQKRELLLKNL